MSEDRPQVPGDGQACGEVTFRRGEGVGRSSSLEEEKGEEGENLGPYACVMREGVDAERRECGKHDENGSPAVVQGEWKVDKDLISNACWLVILLDNVVDVSHCRRDEKREYESCERRHVRDTELTGCLTESGTYQ